MNNLLLSVLFAASLGRPAFAADIRKATRSDGSEITYYLELPSDATSYPLLLLIQGSGCSSAYKSRKEKADKYRVAILTVERYGVATSTESTAASAKECPREFLAHNSVSQTVEDHLRVIQALRRTEKRWNGSLAISGGSEGGILGPILATYLPETTGLAVLCAPDAMTMGESWAKMIEQGLRSEKASENKIARVLREVRAQYDTMHSDPTPNKSWEGADNTYKWWDSILNIRPANYLLDLDIPILVAHGTDDSMASVEGARRLAELFKEKGKTNLTYREYPGFEHCLTAKDDPAKGPAAVEAVIEWLAATASHPR